LILVAATVLAATLVGVFCEQHGDRASGPARLCLTLVLYAVLPFVST
jgi:hypothetical protein